jgi:ring-1,2-phenylacetyl-CoA epoxidase subunit PaaE
LEGQVRMDRNFALEPADRDAGFILTCQAHPLSDRLVVSFDER